MAMAKKTKPAPFGRTERVNDLRVALASIKIVARDRKASESRKTLRGIVKMAEHALERDTSRAAVSIHDGSMAAQPFHCEMPQRLQSKARRVLREKARECPEFMSSKIDANVIVEQVWNALVGHDRIRLGD
jgi:hypothetical protein